MSASFRISSKVKELRIHLCQTGALSSGVRNFIEKYYVKIKSNNPKFPILIRECSGVTPVLWTRYDRGREKSVSLNNMSPEDILSKVKSIAN